MAVTLLALVLPPTLAWEAVPALALVLNPFVANILFSIQ
jgi:hypothetical protein